jgi:hypothetical protein
LITWGNGTCMQPETYGALLRFVASQGFIVIAANSREAGTGSPITKALDFMLAANSNASSAYFQRIDATRIGAMGHSQGAAAVESARNDARIKAMIYFNGGSTIQGAQPILLVSGVDDISGQTASPFASAVNNASHAAAYIYFNSDPHITTSMMSGYLAVALKPAWVTGATGAFWRMTLNSDAEAKTWYVGPSCMLCGQSAYNFGEHGFD